MANCMCFTSITSFKPLNKPGLIAGNCSGEKVEWIRVSKSSKDAKFSALEVKAATNDQNTKTNSILCGDCDGNGVVKCRQCQGTGVNSVDHFNGQFKAGALCWLCRGKKDILCGNCNGAGFLGGFLSSFDD